MLRERWMQLFPSHVQDAPASGLVTSWWERVVAKYAEPVRYYHTLTHIARFVLETLLKYDGHSMDKMIPFGCVIACG